MNFLDNGCPEGTKIRGKPSVQACQFEENRVQPHCNVTLIIPNIEAVEENTINIDLCGCWMTPIVYYMQTDQLPQDELKEKQIHKYVAKCTLMLRKLYKIGRVSHMLRFLGEHQITRVLVEVHHGTIGRQTFAHKMLRESYYWNSLMRDIMMFVKKYDKC